MKQFIVVLTDVEGEIKLENIRLIPAENEQDAIVMYSKIPSLNNIFGSFPNVIGYMEYKNGYPCPVFTHDIVMTTHKEFRVKFDKTAVEKWKEICMAADNVASEVLNCDDARKELTSAEIRYILECNGDDEFLEVDDSGHIKVKDGTIPITAKPELKGDKEPVKFSNPTDFYLDTMSKRKAMIIDRYRDHTKKYSSENTGKKTYIVGVCNRVNIKKMPIKPRTALVLSANSSEEACKLYYDSMINYIEKEQIYAIEIIYGPTCMSPDYDNVIIAFTSLFDNKEKEVIHQKAIVFPNNFEEIQSNLLYLTWMKYLSSTTGNIYYQYMERRGLLNEFNESDDIVIVTAVIPEGSDIWFRK